MSNEEFIQSIATRAQKKIGGTGAVAGTIKHKYAKDLGVRAQDRFGQRGLEFERGYKDGTTLKIGDSRKGSTRLDVYDRTTKTVYDYKFVRKPGKGLKPQQLQKIKEHGPLDTKEIKEINP